MTIKSFKLFLFLTVIFFLTGCFNADTIKRVNVQMDKMDKVVIEHNKKISDEMEADFGDDLKNAKQEIKDKAKQTAYNLAEKGFKFVAETLTTESKKRIDAWLADHGLNEYGDDKNVEYIGGTPLFNEQTGEKKDKYEYILEKHPELVEELNLSK